MVFFDLLVLLTFVWFSRKLFQCMRFPALFGEVFAGLLAGPLILGLVTESEPLMILAELGIFFLMFHAGLEANPKELMKASKKALTIAVGGMVVPFVMGYGVALWYSYDVLTSLFVGLVLSVTAVAITARMFKDEKIAQTEMAHVVLAAAIMTEVVMLVLLSVLFSVAESGGLNLQEIFFLVAKFVGYFVGVFIIGDKLFPYLYRILYKGNKGFTFSIMLALAFGVIAEVLGLHMIIGAFLAGLFLRQELLDSSVFDKIEDRVFGLSYSFLGPIFFATLAFHITFDALFEQPIFLLVMFVVAVLGKIIGSALPALLSGMNRSESLGVGMAMNSRGEVDLIIIALGFSAGLVDQDLFSVLVMVIFATTLFSILAIKPLVPSIKSAHQRMNQKSSKE